MKIHNVEEELSQASTIHTSWDWETLDTGVVIWKDVGVHVSSPNDMSVYCKSLAMLDNSTTTYVQESKT